MKGVRGEFGHDKVKTFSSTFGLNKNGRMDKEELKKYSYINVIPLYQDVCNIIGKCILVKIDSGPRRMILELIAQLQLMGFYLFPCIPNTAGVTQETHKKYGLFKSKFETNMSLCCF